MYDYLGTLLGFTIYFYFLFLLFLFYFWHFEILHNIPCFK